MKNPEKRIFTVPNVLSFIRIFCIPLFVYFFYNENFITAGLILACSGITDLFDGVLARKLNQITELGKMLDPVADKLTEAAIAILLFLVFRGSEEPIYNSFLCWVFLFFIGKEALMLLIGGILLLFKIKPVAAEFYGKLSTFSFYIIMVTLLIFGPEIGAIPRRYPQLSWMVLPEWITVALVITAALLAVVAFFSYFPPVYRQMKKTKAEKLAAKEENLEAKYEEAQTEVAETAEEIEIEEVTEIQEVEEIVEVQPTEETVEEESVEEKKEEKMSVDDMVNEILSEIKKKEN
ncbi:MAG: CDP-alcohol phosphatidyltransferase family protein [Clostridia bacterium]|nr:CDP-alcohol phosphatidyltransferase family protein [Clostridia bacterium]